MYVGAFVALTACTPEVASNTPTRATANYPQLTLSDSLVSEAVVLAVDTGAHVLSEMSAVLPLGRSFIGVSADRQHLLRFDSSGALVKVTGSGGRGPGEFERLDMLVPLNGLRLLAKDHPRYHILDSALHVVRSFTAPSLDCQYEIERGDLLCTWTVVPMCCTTTNAEVS